MSQPNMLSPMKKFQHHFKQYSSIENHYQYFAKQIPLDPNYDPSVLWTVSEKVHGCNFSFVMWKQDSEVVVKVASRRQFIVNQDVNSNPSEVSTIKHQESSSQNISNEKDDDKFFPEAVDTIRNKYEQRMVNMFEELCEKYSNENFKVRRVNIFGELFGGKYPHPSVENVKGRSPIQHHVYYTPDYDFYLFDVYIWGLHHQQDEKKETGFFMDYDEMVQLLQKHSFTLYAKELFRGTLEECLNFDSNFSTRIPIEFYRLPKLENYENICEGVVIKPIRDMYTKEKNERFMIKKKNEAFNEVTRPKKAPRPRKTIKKPKFEHAETATPVLQALEQYLNTSRLESAISKIGDILKSFKLRNQCLALLVQDALADYKKEHLSEWEQVKKIDQKSITKYLSEEAKEVICDYVYEVSTNHENTNAQGLSSDDLAKVETE